MVALQNSNFKHVLCYHVNQQQLGLRLVVCDIEWVVAFIVAWNCHATPKRELSRVRNAFIAVKLLFTVENCPRCQLVIFLKASI